MMRLDLATAEYIGARAQQQDLAAAMPLSGGAVLVLADGLGGHESGAEASRIVVETFKEAGASGRFKNPGTRRQTLRDTVDRANTRIAEGVDPAHGHRGMASTVVAAVVSDGELNWVSVGDSHLYVWRGGRLHKLNEDHSQAGLMVRSGQYHASDPEVQAVKSVLVSALTGRKLEIVDLPQRGFKLEVGDVLMLASDGLNTLEDQEVEGIIAEVAGYGAVKLSTTLLERVRSRRVERQDNTTVAIARILPPVAAEAGDPTRTSAAETHSRRPKAAVALDHASEALTERLSNPLPQPDLDPAPEQAPLPEARSAAAVEQFSGEPSAGSGSRPAVIPKANLGANAAVASRTEPEGAEPATPPVSDPAPAAEQSVAGESAPEVGNVPPTGVEPDAVGEEPGRRRRLARAVAGVVLIWLVAGLIAIASIAVWRPDWLNGWLPGFGPASRAAVPETPRHLLSQPAAAPARRQAGEASDGLGSASATAIPATAQIDASATRRGRLSEQPVNPPLGTGTQAPDPALPEAPPPAARRAPPR